MKVVFMVMAVSKASVRYTVSLSLGIVRKEKYEYLGSLSCELGQFMALDDILRRLPKLLVEYRSEKWDVFFETIRKELDNGE